MHNFLFIILAVVCSRRKLLVPTTGGKLWQTEIPKVCVHCHSLFSKRFVFRVSFPTLEAWEHGARKDHMFQSFLREEVTLKRWLLQRADGGFVLFSMAAVTDSKLCACEHRCS